MTEMRMLLNYNDSVPRGVRLPFRVELTLISQFSQFFGRCQSNVTASQHDKVTIRSMTCGAQC